VDVDLRAAAPKLVIDASISDGKPCTVYLTKSQAFNDNDTFKTVTGAEIILDGEDGNSEELVESNTMDGLYVSHTVGEAGKRYFLKVTAQGQTYEANAAIPDSVPIEKTYIYDIKAGNKSWYSPAYVFHDPPGENNYYYTILYVNDVIMNTIYLDDDKYRNGLEVHRILFFNKDDNDGNDLKTGDRIRIEMQSLDKGMYLYYKSMFSVAADGGTNPITNFTGDALGCFKAYSSSHAEFTVSSDIVYSGE
jgi:hypothetical protein